MRLIDNWRQVLLFSHSMHCFVASLIALLLPDAIWIAFGRETNPRFWFFIGLILLIAGMVLRLRKQGINDA